jgi:hypothetical protein
MSVQVDYFSTTKFILKADKVERLKELIKLLEEEGNTGTGYYSSDHYINLREYGNNAFSIHTGGYCDGGPELWDTVVNGFNSEEYESEEEQNDFNGSHSIFHLVQQMLEEDSWFFVDSTGFEKGRIYNNTWFHHANGTSDGIDTWDLKKKILDKHKINGSVY